MEKIRFTMEMTSDLDNAIWAYCRRSGCTKSQFVRKAIALMLRIDEARRDGYRAGITKDAGKLDTEFVGL